MATPPPPHPPWEFSESDEDDYIFLKPPCVYAQRAKELLDLLQDPAKTDTKKILESYKIVVAWRDDDRIPEIARQIEREQQQASASTSTPPPPASVPVEQRGLKRLTDVQLEQIKKNKKAAMERKMLKQEEACLADVAKWNMRWSSCPPEL